MRPGHPAAWNDTIRIGAARDRCRPDQSGLGPRFTGDSKHLLGHLIGGMSTLGPCPIHGLQHAMPAWRRSPASHVGYSPLPEPPLECFLSSQPTPFRVTRQLRRRARPLQVQPTVPLPKRLPKGARILGLRRPMDLRRPPVLTYFLLLRPYHRLRRRQRSYPGAPDPSQRYDRRALHESWL